jgi:uncharacterized protein YjgD (DUF1641 family)
MAEPTDSYPEAATNGARKASTNGDGEAALEAALAAHGEDLADLVEGTDELQDALATAILIVASADDDEVEYVTSSTANLVEAVDGLSTDEAAALAGDLGENADDLAAALETVLELQREGHLDDLVTIATGFSGSLSAEEVEALSTMLEEDGSDVVEALDVVLELQREGSLEELVDLADTLSTLDIDADAAAGLDRLLGAVGEAEREAEPVGLLGFLRRLGGQDVRAGLGYVLAILKAQGRRLGDR